MVRCRSHVVMLSCTMGHTHRFLRLLLFIYCLFEHGGALFMNPPRLLLPYNYGIPSNFTLSIVGEGECPFEWKSTNPNIVVIDPICESPDCCREAVVSVVSSASERIHTQVIAIYKGDTISNNRLECEVMTDTPSSIELSSLTEQLFLGESEIVTVVAKDKFGNCFSSINGLHFQWQNYFKPVNTLGDTPDKEDRYAALLPFPASKYNSAMERRGMLGHRIIFKPTDCGVYYLSASLKRRDLIDLTNYMRMFFVDRHVRIHPSQFIYLLQFASVNIYVEAEGKKLENIKATEKSNVIEGFKYNEIDTITDTESDFGSQKILMIKDNIKATEKSDEIAAVIYNGIDTIIVTGSDFGRKEFDITKDSIEYQTPIGNLVTSVVRPAELRFRISGGDFTTLQEMQFYTITVEIFDVTGNLIYPSENLRIAVNFPSSLFYVNTTTSNGTYHVVQALVPGKGILKAEFKGVLRPDGTIVNDVEISTSIELTICQKLEISPAYVLLPTASNTSPLHQIRLMASGGTGKYQWSTDVDDGIASVHFDKDISHVGYLSIHKESDFNVVISDTNNPNFLANSLVSVQSVLDIEVYPTIVESEVGNIIILPVALLAYEHKDKKIIRKFDDCSRIKPTIEIIEKHVISLDEEPHIPAFGKGCLSLQFRCLASGYSRINIFYDSKHGNDVITHKTTTVLACFKPLKPVHPVRVAVLPLGATKEIAFEGGSRRWPLYKDGHFAKLEGSRPELVDFEIIRDPIRYNKDLTVFKVTCKGLGENNLTFRIGNEASATNPHPAKQETEIKFFCSEPDSIHLKLPQKKKNNLLEDNIVKVPFYGEKLFSIDVWIKDSMGRKLSNISSLNVEFHTLDNTLIEDTESDELSSYDNAVSGYRKITRDYKEFKLTGGTGDLRLTAKVKSYNKDVLQKLGIAKPRELKEISTSIDLKLVSLRDINAGLYLKDDTNNPVQVEEGTCDEDSCKS